MGSMSLKVQSFLIDRILHDMRIMISMKKQDLQLCVDELENLQDVSSC